MMQKQAVLAQFHSELGFELPSAYQAVLLAFELRGGAGIQAQSLQFFQQGRAGLAIFIQPHRYRHQFDLHGLVLGLAQHARDVRGQTARRGVGGDDGIGCSQTLRLQASGQGVCKRRPQFGQRLGREFFYKEFDEEVLRAHGGVLLLLKQ